ncbi:hypothetical protein PIB30_112158, partial [Stylosanthes scabra]|nr:hypothetical protein [Stylosanthes scabra]
LGSGGYGEPGIMTSLATKIIGIQLKWWHSAGTMQGEFNVLHYNLTFASSPT